MIATLEAGLAAGTAVVLLCTSNAFERVRRVAAPIGVLECHFCTSIWVAIAAAAWIGGLQGLILRSGAVAAIANITILLIHLSISTVGGTSDEPDASDS